MPKNIDVNEPVKRKKGRSQGQEIFIRFCRNKGAMLGAAIFLALIFLAIFADVLFDYDTQISAIYMKERFQSPNAEHWFGTDEVGRDLFARVMYGARYSVAIGVACAAMAAVFGIPLGAIAGYYGGLVDEVIMRVADMISCVPSLLMGIVVVSALGVSVPNLIIAVSIHGIAGLASTTRVSVMRIRNEEYIESARAIGLRNRAIIFAHLLPNSLSPILVSLTLRMANGLVAASSLSFLGLGVPVPTPEWGALLSAGRAYIRGYSYLTFFPGMAILITVMALNLMGDGLRDAMDPKLRK